MNNLLGREGGWAWQDVKGSIKTKLEVHCREGAFIYRGFKIPQFVGLWRNLTLKLILPACGNLNYLSVMHLLISLLTTCIISPSKAY